MRVRRRIALSRPRARPRLEGRAAAGWRESAREAPGGLPVWGREDWRRLERATLGEDRGIFVFCRRYCRSYLPTDPLVSPVPTTIRSSALWPRTLATAWLGPWNSAPA